MVKRSDLVRLSEYVWEIPRSYRGDMKVPARIYASNRLLKLIFRDRSLKQLVNTAAMPGVVKRVLVMPDAHQGYGPPIGGVVPTRYPDGVISPGAVGYDINCGVRLMASELMAQEVLEEVGYRAVIVGFPLLALGIALGAYWANSAWGRYWGWDAKETSSLVTWLVYAGYLHMRGLRRWQGMRSAVLLVVGFLAVLFTYFGVNLWVSGLHSYSGV